MRREHQELTTIKFNGPSFEDHGLELDVLTELVQYKRILIETATEIWRRNNPNRERVPRGFEKSMRIKFYELREGSTAVPLIREIEHIDNQLSLDFELDDELDQAVEIIEAGIQSAQEDTPLSEDFPRNVLPLFENLGRTLGKGDSIQVKSPKRKHQVEFTPKVGERLVSMLDRTYEDIVDFIGEVRQADLDGQNFTIRLDDGAKIQGKFEPEQEPIIIGALKEHATCRLKLKGMGQFNYRDATIKKVIRVDNVDVSAIGAVDYNEKAKPVWEMIREIGAKVPETEWDQVPTDLSKELDHYLYGSPFSKQ